MYTKIILTILTFALLIIGCSSQEEVLSKQRFEIDWDALQLTPRPSENLCVEISPEELNWDKLKQDFPYGLFGGIYPADSSHLQNWRMELYGSMQTSHSHLSYGCGIH